MSKVPKVMASFFKMEDLMSKYVPSNILSYASLVCTYLDFKSMVVARMVSKTWYDLIENDGGPWNNLMRKRFEDVQKNHETLRLAGCFSHDWRRD